MQTVRYYVKVQGHAGEWYVSAVVPHQFHTEEAAREALKKNRRYTDLPIRVVRVTEEVLE